MDGRRQETYDFQKLVTRRPKFLLFEPYSPFFGDYCSGLFVGQLLEDNCVQLYATVDNTQSLNYRTDNRILHFAMRNSQ